MLAPHVFIQTYCEHPALAYGSLLVFDSLRIGFPSANVTVVDNGSHPEFLPKLRNACARVGALLHERPRGPFLRFFEEILIGQWQNVAIVDPDVMFWDNMESTNVGGLLSGRKIPDLVNFGVTSVSRIHPSMVFIPDVPALRDEIQRNHVRSVNVLGQVAVHLRGEKLFFDTLAPLTQMLGEKAVAFGPNELDKYDHLFYGSHLPVIQPGLHDDGATMRAHVAAAMGNSASLRGLWREQEKAFKQANSGAIPANPYPDMIDAGKALAKAQGLEGGHTEAVHGLIRELSHA